MKNLLKNFGRLLLLLILVTSCQDDDKTFGGLDAPKNITLEHVIVGQSTENPDGDGSGKVILKAKADNAVSFKYIFSDGSANAPGGVYTKTFAKDGLNTYTVTVVAYGKGGTASNTSFEVTVFSDFSDPEAITLLTSGDSKTWYWAAAVPGHLGVGENSADVTKNFYPNYYSAAPFEKAGSPTSSCLYENELRFFVENGALKFELDNGGKTFFNADFLSVGNGSGSGDQCLTYNTSGVKSVTLSPSESPVAIGNTRGTSMTFSDGGFMGYYINQSTYEILELTENKMVVRAVMGGNPALAWYHTFSTQPPVQGGGPDPEPGADYTNLIWQDEFNVQGAPNPANWSYNIGRGDNGWGNGEAQYYTDRPENVKVEGGMLKITAKKEDLNGAAYTSARLVSENKVAFRYGKIEFRAKLPIGGGTWPAVWMLGANYQTNPWPACGEIDMMEHKGNEQNKIHGTLHYPGRSAGNANTGSTTITNASSEFHVYKVIWSPTKINFYVDDQPAYHSVDNSTTLPFNANFFLIMNFAMGGTFGGNIDPAYTSSTMEVDYIRVYQ